MNSLYISGLTHRRRRLTNRNCNSAVLGILRISRGNCYQVASEIVEINFNENIQPK